MSEDEPFRTLSGILSDVAKGRGLVEKPLSTPMKTRISNLVKEGMTYWSEIDAPASFEWTREDVSNYTPDDVVALLDEIRKIWDEDMLIWIEENTFVRDHAYDTHDLGWN